MPGRFVQRLHGLSKTEVWLWSDDGERWRVRKVAADEAVSRRLQLQLTKQQRLVDAVDAPVRVPEVLDQGTVDGRFWFDMAFVHGIDAPTYLRRGQADDVIRFTAQLVDYVQWAWAADPWDGGTSTDLFDGLFGRLCAVRRACEDMSPTTFERLALSLERWRGDPVGRTWCHGDLTLENIQVDRNGDLWFFDLLDAPHEHVFQDVAKLHQDLAGSWYRRTHERVSAASLRHVSDAVTRAATALDDRYQQLHPVLVAMCFARILPYAESDADRAAVRRGLEFFVNIIDPEKG